MQHFPTIEQVLEAVGEENVSPSLLILSLKCLGFTEKEVIEGIQRAIEQDYIRIGDGGFVERGSYYWA